MRLVLLPALAFALAACGSKEFEDAFKVSFRKSFLESCVASAQKASGTQADFAPVCGCVADKLIAESTSAKELTAAAASDEKTSRAVAQCRK